MNTAIEKQIKIYVVGLENKPQSELDYAPVEYDGKPKMLSADSLSKECEDNRRDVQLKIMRLFISKALEIHKLESSEERKSQFDTLKADIIYAKSNNEITDWYIIPELVPELDLKKRDSHIAENQSQTTTQFAIENGFTVESVGRFCADWVEMETQKAKKRHEPAAATSERLSKFMYKADEVGRPGHQVWYITPRGGEVIKEGLQKASSTEVSGEFDVKRVSVAQLAGDFERSLPYIQQKCRVIVGMVTSAFLAIGKTPDEAGAEVRKYLFKPDIVKGTSEWKITELGAKALFALHEQKIIGDGDFGIWQIAKELGKPKQVATIYCDRMFNALVVSRISEGKTFAEAVAAAQELVYKSKRPAENGNAYWVVTPEGLEALKNLDIEFGVNTTSPSAMLALARAANGALTR